MLCCLPTSCAIKDKVFVVVHSPVWTPSPFVSSEAAAALWCAAPSSSQGGLPTTTELTERTFCGAAAAANKQMLQLTSERAKEGRNEGAALLQCSRDTSTKSHRSLPPPWGKEGCLILLDLKKPGVVTKHSNILQRGTKIGVPIIYGVACRLQI